MSAPRLPDGERPSSTRRRLPPDSGGHASPRPDSTSSHPRPTVSPTAEPEDNQPTVITTVRPRPATDALAAGNFHGRHLGHFELLEAIGVGGMAAVLRARDLQLGRVVALKILPPEMAVDPEHIARFKLEARAAALLDHDNIARVYFCGEDQGLHFIAFEYVEGVNLRVLLEREGPLPASDAVHTMLEVARGLAHAAARGVVHRDIKPSNIIVTPEGRAKIVDMGLARLDVPVSGGVTQSGVTLGTFDYISPEQALEPRTADARSDIYSLGCTFYHAVTGQPPVPEGTAAKKLHHHQHVAPLDPRQLNPGLPDELAAVLARMMAKDPRQRYQTPDELVDALTRLDRRLDSAPAGGRPAAGSSPLLVGALAAALVTGLVVYLNGTHPSDTAADPVPAFIFGTPARPAATKPDRPAPPPQPALGEKPPPADPGPKPPPAADAKVVGTVEELAKALGSPGGPAGPGPSARVRLRPGTYDLTGRPDGLLFEGAELELTADDPARPPVIRLGAGRDAPPAESPAPRAALTLGSAPGNVGKLTATIKGVRFVLDSQAAGLPLRAVAARGRYALRLERCTFEQSPGSAAGTAVACQGWAADDPAGPDTVATRHFVELDGCFFAGGGTAVQVTGRAGVQARQCAFAPYRSVFRIEEPAGATAGLKPAEVRLESCTALLDHTVLFRLDGPADCKADALHCVFAQADPPGPEAEAVLAHAGRAGGTFRYNAGVTADDLRERRNAYHGLTAFRVEETRAGRPQVAANLDDCVAQKLPIHDDPASELPVRPWADSRPTEVLARGDLPRAFALDPTRSALRVTDAGSAPLGVQRVEGLALYPAALPKATDQGPATKAVRVVDPRAADRPRVGVYASLAEALAAAQSGDAVLVKVNGPVRVAPFNLNKAGLTLAVRPFPGYRPELTLDKDAARDKLTALFRVYDGSLTLERLRLSLRPETPRQFTGLSVAAVVGGGACVLRECVVTLESNDNPLSVWALENPDDVMKMAGGPPPTPRLELHECLVRGKGQLLDVRSDRPFELAAEGSVVALDGSLLTIDAARKEQPPEAKALIRLRQVTAHLTEHLIAVRGADEKARPGLVQHHFDATNCLFVPPSAGRALVRLDGTDNEKVLQQLVRWTGEGNVYADTVAPWIDLQAGGDAMPAMPLQERDWSRLFGDADRGRSVARVRLPSLPPDRPLTLARPEDFRPTFPPAAPGVEPTRAGAPVDRLPAE